MPDKEFDLLSKLFLTGHLNVAEREQLSIGKVCASKARSLIREAVITKGWFPSDKQKPIDNAGGEYIQLEHKPNNGAALHINTESSYLHFSHKIQTFDSLDKAIDTFIREQELHDLDWLKVDWDA